MRQSQLNEVNIEKQVQTMAAPLVHHIKMNPADSMIKRCQFASVKDQLVSFESQMLLQQCDTLPSSLDLTEENLKKLAK